MIIWEYKMLFVSQDETFAEVGSQGWELVTAIATPDTDYFGLAFFKRKKVMNKKKKKKKWAY